MHCPNAPGTTNRCLFVSNIKPPRHARQYTRAAAPLRQPPTPLLTLSRGVHYVYLDIHPATGAAFHLTAPTPGSRACCVSCRAARRSGGGSEEACCNKSACIAACIALDKPRPRIANGTEASPPVCKPSPEACVPLCAFWQHADFEASHRWGESRCVVFLNDAPAHVSLCPSIRPEMPTSLVP